MYEMKTKIPFSKITKAKRHFSSKNYNIVDYGKCVMAGQEYVTLFVNETEDSAKEGEVFWILTGKKEEFEKDIETICKGL